MAEIHATCLPNVCLTLRIRANRRLLLLLFLLLLRIISKVFMEGSLFMEAQLGRKWDGEEERKQAARAAGGGRANGRREGRQNNTGGGGGAEKA